MTFKPTITDKTFWTIAEALDLRMEELERRIDVWERRGGGITREHKQKLIADARREMDRIKWAKVELKVLGCLGEEVK